MTPASLSNKSKDSLIYPFTLCAAGIPISMIRSCGILGIAVIFGHRYPTLILIMHITYILTMAVLPRHTTFIVGVASPSVA